MELVQELFVTAFVALVFSFVVAKLVSVAMRGDDEGELGLKSSEKVCGVRVVEEAKCDGGLRVRSTRSKKKVRFVDESVVKVDEFEGKRCDSAVICDSDGRIGVVEVGGVALDSSEEGRLTEAAVVAQIVGRGGVDGIEREDAVTSLDGLVVVGEGSERKEADDVEGVVKEGEAMNELVFEEKIVVNSEADCKIDAGFVVKDIVVAQGAEVDGIEEEDAVTSFDGLVVEKGSESKELTQDNGSVIKEEDSMNAEADRNLEDESAKDDGGVGQAVEVRVVESGENQENEIKQPLNKGDEEIEAGSGRKEVEEVDGAIKEGKAMTGLVFDEEIVEKAEGDHNFDAASAKDDDVVGQGGEIRDVESGIEQGLNKGDEKEEELVGDEEDDWEGIERTELDEVFAAAADYVASGGKDDQRLLNMGSDVQMRLYGLHKVAMEGPCHEPQPMALKISSRAKWNAWQRMGNMNPEVAMEQYIALLSEKVPGWMEGKPSGDDDAESLESGIPAAPNTNISSDQHTLPNSMKKRELDDSGTQGGDLTGSSNSVNNE